MLIACLTPAQAVTISADSFEYGTCCNWHTNAKTCNESTITLNGTVDIDDWEVDSHVWTPTGTSAAMNGNGTIYGGTFMIENCYGKSLPENISIGSGVKFQETSVALFEGPKYDIDATFVNSNLEVHEQGVDIRDAKFSGVNNLMLANASVVCNTLTTSSNFGVYTYFYSDYPSNHTAIIKGNLTLNGGGFRGDSGKMNSTDWSWSQYLSAFSGVVFEVLQSDGAVKVPTLTIQGTLTIQSETGITFLGYQTADSLTDYIPSSEQAIFVCETLKDEASLSKLKPYVAEEYFIELNEEDWVDYVEYKLLSDYAFVAATGADGYTYIYLTLGGAAPDVIPAGATEVAEGESYTVGTDGTPTADEPLYLTGGTVDAGSADTSVLNNQLVMGTAGTLLTTADQTFTATGSSVIGYGIESKNADTAGANLQIGSADTAKSYINLKGDSYESAATTVQNALLTVSQTATLGTGDDAILSVGEGGAVTNFGTIAAVSELSTGSSMLNQGAVQGDVAVAENAVLTNNGTIAGDVTLADKAKGYGSGAFNGHTIVNTGALLYVGNSPGYQKHTALTLRNGANLGAYIDGLTPATATNNGSGTHSFLSVSGALTLEGAVTVQVGVGRGILNAGNESFTLVLMKADASQITENTGAAFTLDITEGAEYLDEETTELTWDKATGELKFSATVSEEALAALNADGAWDFANTLWASTAVVRDFVRSAEQQAIIGMPGQTTMWGGAIGSFVDMQDGFTYNGGGYAVGVQHAFTEKLRAGVALGQSFGTFKSDDDYLESSQMGIMTAATMQYVTPIQQGKSYMGISGHVGFGCVENDADTWNGFSRGKAEWDDTVYNVGFSIDWRKGLTESTSVTLFAGLDYIYGSQDTINATVGEISNQYRDGSMQVWRLPIGVTLRSEIGLGGTKLLAPELTLAFVGDIARKNPRVKCSAFGESWSETGSTPGREAFMLSTGFNLLFDQNWSVGAFYTLETRDEQINQNANVALRYSF